MIERLLPEDFLRVYRRALGADPPAEFLEAYEVLCDALYWGVRSDDHPWISRRRRSGGYWFGAPELLTFKQDVDRRLAALRAELRRYASARRRPPERRAAPPRAGERDLAPPRGAWNRNAP